MTDPLTIDHIVATSPDDGLGLAGRVDRIVHRVAKARLERALGANAIGADGDWCIPRVALRAALDFERPDTSLEELLAQAVLDAIASAMRGPDAVHYPRRIDALADLVASASLGRFDRAWAWVRMGLINDPTELERRRGPCVLDVLARHPSDAVSAVTRAASTIGLAPLHRLFTLSGWVRLVDIVIDAHVPAASASAVTDLVRQDDNALATIDTASEIARASRLVGSSRLANAARESRLRFDSRTSRALAALVVAESEPGMLSGKRLAPALLTVAQMVAGTVQALAETPSAAAKPAAPQRMSDADSVPDRSTDDEAARQPDSPITDQASGAVGEPTQHAGVVFLLNVARDAGMPETLLDDPALDGFDPGHLLARLALTLAPMPDDDPALIAFAGLDEKRMRRGWSREPLPPEIFERIRTYADKWAAAASERMGRDDEDRRQVVAEIVDRTGRIEREQGWIDVHLALADVDLDIRRAGLDLDPGWVPWLGSVVRFCYA
jgi:hypothetical protein